MRRAGIALVLVAAVLGGASWWLLGTSAGARFAVRQVQERAGLHVGAVEGRLWDRIAVTDLRFEGAGVAVEIDSLQLEWAPGALLDRRLHLRRLSAPAVRVTYAPPDAPAGPPRPSLQRLPLDLRIDALRVDRLTVMVPQRPARTLRDVALAGSWTGAKVTLERLAGVDPGLGATELSGAATLGGDGIDIATLRIAGPAVAELRGFVGWTADSKLELAWTQLRWPLTGEAPQVASPRGRATLQGRPGRWQAALDGDALWRDVAVTLSAEGAGDGSRVRLSRFLARAAQGEVAGSGDIAWSPQLTMDLTARLAGVQPQQWFPALDGVFNGEVAMRGTWTGARAVSLEGTLHDSRWLGRPVSARGSIRLQGAQWTVDELVARSGDTRVELAGAVWPLLDARARLDSGDLGSLWPGLSGAAQGTARAQGSVQAPQLRAEIAARHVAFGPVDAARVRARVDIDRARRLQLKAEVVDAQSGKIPSIVLEAAGPLAAHELRLHVDSPAGVLDLGARGALDLPRARWEGRLVTGRLAPARVAPWTLREPAALVLGATLSLQPACWSSDTARACVRLFHEGATRRVAFRLQSFPTTYLAPLLRPGLSSTGEISGTAQLDWNERGLADVRLDLASSRLELRQHDQPLLAFEPGYARIAPRGGGLRADLALPLGGGGIMAHAQLGGARVFRERRLRGQLDVRLQELTLLRLLTPEIAEVAGSAQGRFEVEGTLAQPRFRGELVLVASQLRLATPNLELTALAVTAQSEPDGRLVLRGSAAAGGGTLTLAGAIDPRAEPLQADITLKGEHMQVTATPEARIWASPDLRLQRNGAGLLLTGTVLVPQAEITPRRREQGLGASPDQVIVRAGEEAPAPVLEVRAEVTVQLGEKVTFDGLGLKTRLTGAIAVSDEGPGPARGRGEIRLDGGRYQAYGQDLTITTGRLIFDGGAVTDPAIELRAERKPREDVTVGVTARGRLDRPEFALFSVPSMPQEEQLSWLVLGRPLQATGSGGQDRALLAGAALSLGLSGSDYLAQRLRGRLGVDEIQIGSRPGESTDTAALTLGKYLSPKLYVSYGISLFQPGHTLRLRYDLGRGFKLQTETGVESGGDLLYSIDR